MRRAQKSNRRGAAADHRERLSEAGMVDLLGMFRRRARNRGPQGFARSHPDITALGDSIGGMLTQPVRDAPPIARNAIPEAPPLLRREAPPALLAEKPRPRSAGNGAATPRFANKAG